MRQIKYLLVLSLAIMTVFTSCEKDEGNDNIEPSDNLEQFGMFGNWKLDSREINGISSLAVECCDYIEFKTDSNLTDLKGLFRANGVGYETNGVFELDTLNETIVLSYDDKQKVFGIQISDNRIVFSYLENNDSIVEHWIKEE